MKKNILYTLLFFGIFTLSFSNNTTVNSIVIKTEQQRLLCERITKNYLMIASNIKIHAAKSQIYESSILFEKNLKEISLFNTNEKIRTINNKISNVWSTYLSKISNDFDKTKSMEIMELYQIYKIFTQNLRKC